MLTIDTSEVCNPPRGIVGYSVLCAAWRLFIISKPLRRSRLRQRCRLPLALCLFGGRLGGSLAIQLVDPFARHPLDEEIGGAHTSASTRSGEKPAVLRSKSVVKRAAAITNARGRR
jgi:hypothetical protein